MIRTRHTPQLLASLLAATVLALAGCSSESDGGGDGSGSDGGSGNEFSALGVSFEAPEGWESLDPEDTGLTEEGSGEIAEGLGMTAEQLTQAVQSVDLFVVDGGGPQDGFLSNINVLGQPGQLPPEDQIEEQFTALGAQVVDVTTEDTEVGEVTAVQYSLDVQDNTVEGVSYLFAQDEEVVVTITVSTQDRATSTEIGDAIVDSLATAS